MKVILLKDVPKVGKKYDIKNVPDGFGNNFLIARGVAVPATPAKIIEIEKLKKVIAIKDEQDEKVLIENLRKISDHELIIKAKSSDKGHLFSKINKKDIIEKMSKDYGIDLTEDIITLEDGIKQIGEFQIPIKVKGKTASFKLIIESETK